MSTETEHQPNPSGTPASFPPVASEPARTATENAQSGLVHQAVRLARKLDWRIACLLLLAAISIPLWRAIKIHATTPAAQLPVLPVQRVPAGQVTREDLCNEVPIPAEFRPYEEVELHAKVSGYVKEINVDFGDRVKAGQLLATLEVPELQDQLHNAIAVERRAEAEYRAAHLNYTRLMSVVKNNPNLVAQQDLDTAEAKDATAEAAIAAAKAEVDRYQTMVAYTRITAPFDGVITHRYADPGALIQSGTASDTQSLPVVRVSNNYRLRLDFAVSVAYVKDVRVGDPVEVRVESLATRSFTGTITRATLKVNEDTRTMTTEIEVSNPKLELVPGMYCRVMLKVDRRPRALTVPIEAVPPGQTANVYVINERDEIEERPVVLGLETATKYEVISGLKEGEKVLEGSRSQVRPGQRVDTMVIDSTVRKEL